MIVARACVHLLCSHVLMNNTDNLSHIEARKPKLSTKAIMIRPGDLEGRTAIP